MIEKEQVVQLCQALVRQPGTSGNEQGAAEVLKENWKALGFDSIETDAYGNVTAKIQGNRPGKTILFDGHIDTVPVIDEDEWIHPPFAAEIHDQKIYGRGTSDMKGAVAAYTIAAALFAQKTNRDFAGTIVVDGIVHEECFEGVAARKVSEKIKPDYVIIGEASHQNVKIGQRGRAEIVVETFGKSCHSANPQKGINAVYKMCEVIGAIRGLAPTTHPFLGEGILELTDIQSQPYPGASVVPAYCKATFDRRLLVGETKESVLEPIQKLLDELMAIDPDLQVKVSYAIGKETCYTGADIEGERFFPGWLFDEQSDFVQAVTDKLKEKGKSFEVTRYDFCTNGSHYAGEAGIPTLGLGPSLENLAHTRNEYVEIGELIECVERYECILEALMK